MLVTLEVIIIMTYNIEYCIYECSYRDGIVESWLSTAHHNGSVIRFLGDFIDVNDDSINDDDTYYFWW